MTAVRHALINEKTGIVRDIPIIDTDAEEAYEPLEGHIVRALPGNSQVFPGYLWDGKVFRIPVPDDLDDDAPTGVVAPTRTERILSQLGEAKTVADIRLAPIEYFGS